ncbi:MAG: hypothetical protein LBU65_01185 [Planctomycetaceae bacterium]|nr:hypothetical protein [Planctomycetaceae bacterium]
MLLELVDRDNAAVDDDRPAAWLVVERDGDEYVAAFCGDELCPVEQSFTQSCGFLPTQQAACLPPLEAQHDAPLDFVVEVVPRGNALETEAELVAEIAIGNLLM